MNEGTINVLGKSSVLRSCSTSLMRLEHYFEMSKYDAERAFKIYKTFSKQTDLVVQFLSVARQYENATRLEIPKLKHAPTSLTSSLEEYLNDPDFEINRRQYLAQQEAKKGKKPTAGDSSKSAFEPKKSTTSNGFPDPKPAAAAQESKPQEPKGPAPDLIDFFDSIEQNQQAMTTQPQQTQAVQNGPQFFQQPQTTAFPSFAQTPFGTNGQPPPQQLNGFNLPSNPYGSNHSQAQQSMQPDFTGAGFGDYSQQLFGQQQIQFPSVPQTGPPDAFPPPQQQSFSTGQQPYSVGAQSPPSTNPFRQALMPTGASTSSSTASPAVSSSINRQGTNPFARNNGPGPAGSTSSSPFASAPPQQPPQQPPQHFPQQTPQPFQQQQSQQPLQPHRTGTNPFARNTSPPPSQTSAPAHMVPYVTGSTNPFRQSTFVNQQNGQGWQSDQGSMGGLEQLPTVPVFPRPGQPQHPWP